MKKLFFFILLLSFFPSGVLRAAINMERFQRAAAILSETPKNEGLPVNTECAAGEYKNGDQCSPCAFVLPNCLECASATLCTSCANGYERSESGKCTKNGCDDALVNGKRVARVKIGSKCSFPCTNGKNCAECDAGGFCISCLAGYKIAHDRLTCDNCPDNCAECASQTNCKVCLEGYVLIQGRCFKGEIRCPSGLKLKDGGCCAP